jgi:hypothetical protein
LAAEGFSELYRDSFSDGPTIVLKPLERPVQPWRGDFQRIGMGKGIGHIERGTERLVCALAILQRDPFRFIDEHPHDRTGPLPHTYDIRQFEA